MIWRCSRCAEGFTAWAPAERHFHIGHTGAHVARFELEFGASGPQPSRALPRARPRARGVKVTEKEAKTLIANRERVRSRKR